MGEIACSNQVNMEKQLIFLNNCVILELLDRLAVLAKFNRTGYSVK